MAVTKLLKSAYSYIAIKDDKMYIMSNHCKDISPRAFQIAPGFQIEIGRQIDDIEKALKQTRLPFILKEVTSHGDISHYQIIRMHTGKVDDKIIATIVCLDGAISSISFNRALIKDNEYRRYNQLSILHQLSLPYDYKESSCNSRQEQVIKAITTIMSITNPIEVIEETNSISAITLEDELKLKFKFILNKNNNNRYELISIALAN